jgi:hypothetical protein
LREASPEAKATGTRDALSGLNGNPAKFVADEGDGDVRKRKLGHVSVFGFSIALWAALLPIGMVVAIVGGASDIPAFLQVGKVMILLVILPFVFVVLSDFGQVLGFWPYGNKQSKSKSENDAEN